MWFVSLNPVSLYPPFSPKERERKRECLPKSPPAMDVVSATRPQGGCLSHKDPCKTTGDKERSQTYRDTSIHIFHLAPTFLLSVYQCLYLLVALSVQQVFGMIHRNASLCKWGVLLQIPAREPRTSITRRQRILFVRTHRLHYKQRKAEQLGLFSPKELPSFFNLMSQNKLEINYYCLGIIQLRSYNAALKKKNPSNASIISHSPRQNYSHCGSSPFQSHSTCLSFMLITSLYFIKVCMHDVFRSSSSVSLHQKLSPSQHTRVSNCRWFFEHSAASKQAEMPTLQTLRFLTPRLRHSWPQPVLAGPRM